MGYMTALGECCVCRGMVSFNPDLVPSAVVNGTREPICKSCVERANPLRKERGLAEIRILPGAYDAQECA